jgi:Trk-type K+ transport system membrane component
VFYLAEEANNPATLQGQPPGTALLASFVTSVMARTAGFNVIDIGAMDQEALFTTDILMFIGGGSAGTAGGVKVTTIGLLAYVVWSEVRGRADVEVGRRRLSAANQRQALTVAVLGMSVVVLASYLMLALGDLGFDAVLFETVSAFATVGLSTGITDDLTDPALILLSFVMLVGRVGPLTAATSLALRERPSVRRLPEERMIVG